MGRFLRIPRGETDHGWWVMMGDGHLRLVTEHPGMRHVANIKDIQRCFLPGSLALSRWWNCETMWNNVKYVKQCETMWNIHKHGWLSTRKLGQILGHRTDGVSNFRIKATLESARYGSTVWVTAVTATICCGQGQGIQFGSGLLSWTLFFVFLVRFS